MYKKNLQSIIAHAKEYGFIFPSSEIYDGLSAVYDYGVWGAELKNNIRQYWWYSMTRMHDNIVGIDASIFMHPKTWKASGHLDGFSDPMLDNKDSKKRYRVDHLIEQRAGEYYEAGDTEAGDKLISAMNSLLIAKDYVALKKMIVEEAIVCPVAKTKNWTEIRDFNLMFATSIGSVAEEANTIYLRPETAQGIFVNFLNVQKTTRLKIPFGIAQTGKAFRNEIVARQFIFRMREFEQMEMQFFCKPGTEIEWYNYWKSERIKWHQSIGSNKDNYRFHDHTQLAHYANAAVDIEFDFPFGFKELEGIHSRTDFDLKQHENLSKKKMQYFDTQTNKHYIPYVVETSVGLDRMVLMCLSDAYQEENLEGDDASSSRVVLKLPPFLAPVKLALLPLTKKDGLPDIAKDILRNCKKYFYCFYEEKDSIGKRYRRMDALGTPYCITIDHQTKEDNTVTIRYRDSMKQERIAIDKIVSIIQEQTTFPL